MKNKSNENNRFLDDNDFVNKMSDKNFVGGGRSNKYEKGKEETSVKGIGYWIFLIITFLVSYLLFTNFLFK